VDKGDDRSRADFPADFIHLGRWHLFWDASKPAVIASPAYPPLHKKIMS